MHDVRTSNSTHEKCKRGGGIGRQLALHQYLVLHLSLRYLHFHKHAVRIKNSSAGRPLKIVIDDRGGAVFDGVLMTLPIEPVTVTEGHAPPGAGVVPPTVQAHPWFCKLLVREIANRVLVPRPFTAFVA